jgi:hypothetical protein
MNCSVSAIEPDCGDLAEATLRARQLFQLRRCRSKHLNHQLFSEPAWDVLLLLFGEGFGAMSWTAEAFSRATETPVPTMQRWLAIIESEGLIERAEGGTLSDIAYELSIAGRAALHGLLSS